MRNNRLADDGTALICSTVDVQQHARPARSPHKQHRTLPTCSELCSCSLQVLEAVALDREVAALPAREDSLAGERGALLSGGQRCRLALARALYHRRCRVLLLDDVLSSVDNRCAGVIIDKALRGPLAAGKTLVLVTKSLACVAAADWVVALSPDGRLLACGPPAVAAPAWLGTGAAEACSGSSGADCALKQAPESAGKCSGSDEAAPLVLLQPEPLMETAVGEDANPEPQQATSADPASPVVSGDEEQREAGHVKLRTYAAYLRAVGGAMSAMVLASLALMQVGSLLE